MVVVNKQNEFCKLDNNVSQLESTKCSDCSNGGSDAVFTLCDNRGMLKLDQDLVINKGDINKIYRIDKGAPFATGLYAQVRRCESLIHKNTFYAAKFCPRKRPGQKSDEDCIENLHEIALLSQLKHPYIISFIDAFILEDYVVTIMELAPGGDLQTVIDCDLVLLEKDASRYIFQVLEALKYLHERHIAHLDIKPQNLLLMGEFPNCHIKLCDFEISRVINPDKEVKEVIGTPDFVAPEILLFEPLTSAADLWSLGIISYVLLTGFSPFGGDTDGETFRNIIHEPIDFPDELFEDISPSAIDFIVKLTVKNPKLRPTTMEMLEHEWIKSFKPEILPQEIIEPEELEPESLVTSTNTFLSHSGPKKRSPRRTMAGSSTASAAAGRRPSARSILRACKSAYDLNKMGEKTKSREALIEKMKIASGDSSVGGNWKLRKNLSKSREQLWESKIQLSKSCEKINYNLPGSTRWASVANFPSLDLGAMKSSTSQESVISVVSTGTNIGSSATIQQDQFDWQPQIMDDVSCLTPQIHSASSVPNTPPIPNFDLSSPVNNTNMGSNLNPDLGIGFVNNVTHPSSDFNYPSLVNGTNVEDDESEITLSDAQAAAEQEAQKSVAELVMVFGGRVAANAKKLDLKNQFEPILEVDGSEEQTISLGDCSDNNSTSGVSSIIASSVPIITKEPKSAESGHFSMNSSSSSNEQLPESTRINNGENGITNRRHSRQTQHARDETRSTKTMAKNEANNNSRRGSMSPLKTHGNNIPGLKGILKKQASNHSNTTESSYSNGTFHNHHHSHTNENHFNITHPNHLLVPPSSATSSRRGSIPGNCTRLYDTHTISSLAKVPKKSILKTSQSNDKSNRSSSIDNSNTPTPSVNRKQSGERPSSKSPENVIVPKDKESSLDLEQCQKSVVSPDTTPDNASTTTNPNTSKVISKGKIIPKGLSPRERPSFICLSDVRAKPKARKPTTTTTTSSTVTPRLRKPTATTAKDKTAVPPTPRPPPKPRTSIREQILRKKIAEKSGGLPQGDRIPNVTLHLPPLRTNNVNGANKKSPPQSPTEDHNNKNPMKPSTFKTELNIEPAAVAIKIFPPDPVILPKTGLDLEENNNEDSNNNNNNKVSTELEETGNKDIKRLELDDALVISNNNSNLSHKSPEVGRKHKKDSTIVTKGKTNKLEKSTWGVVCTGSIGRAISRLERFESGAVKGKKLRRGSVPDF